MLVVKMAFDENKSSTGCLALLSKGKCFVFLLIGVTPSLGPFPAIGDGLNDAPIIVRFSLVWGLALIRGSRDLWSARLKNIL